MTDPGVWGAAGWRFMVSFIDSNPDLEMQRLFILRFLSFLPCETCSQHSLEALNKQGVISSGKIKEFICKLYGSMHSIKPKHWTELQECLANQLEYRSINF